jgi:Cysteine-rich CPCC
VCFWEDDGAQLRWPLNDDGPNGISLVEAQANYRQFGASHRESRKQVRRPRADEPVDEGWRPLDLGADDIERRPGDSGTPWPTDLTRLYWWRPNYYRSPGAEPVSPALPAGELTNPSPAEQLMARILAAVPETEAIDREVRSAYEEPAPFAFCSELPGLAIDAFESGDDDLAGRLLSALNTGLTDGDPDAYNCVSIAFLEDERWHAPEMMSFIASWPPEIRQEITRQRDHAAQSLAELPDLDSYNRDFQALRAEAGDLDHTTVLERLRALTTSHGMPFGEAEIELFAHLLQDDHWPSRHPVRAMRWAWTHRRSASLRRRLEQLRTRSVRFAG